MTFLHPLRASLCAGLLGLLTAHASAGLLSFRVSGEFPNSGFSNSPQLVAALDPLIEGQTLQLDFSFDTDAPTRLSNNGTLVRASAVSGMRATVAGFQTSSGACAAGSEHECFVSVGNDLNAPIQTGHDIFGIAFGRSRSAALEQATGLSGLTLLLSLSMDDPQGTLLQDLGLAVDLTSLLPLQRWHGVLRIETTDGAGEAQSARFNWVIRGITRLDEPVVNALPEPSSLTLALLALAGVLARHRRAALPSRS